MKRIILVSLMFLTLASWVQGQVLNHELGISPIQIDEYGNINSVFYTKMDRYKFLPKVYFAKRVYKRWKARASFQQVRYKYDEYARFVDSFPHPKRINDSVVSVFMKEIISEVSLGAQFDFVKRKKMNLYVAAEAVFRSNQRSTYYGFKNKVTGAISGYRHNNGPSELISPYNVAYYEFLETVYGPLRFQQSSIKPVRDKGLFYALHVGIQYLISPTFSASYEMGHHSYAGLFLVSRLSLNYHF